MFIAIHASAFHMSCDMFHMHACMPSCMTASMHVRLTDDEERVLREGHARCFVSRISAIYRGKISEEKLQDILEKIKGKEKEFYVRLCAKLAIPPQRPLWLPDPDRPEWMPEFLLKDGGGNASAKSERSTAAPAPSPPKLLAATPKVQIRPAKVPYAPKPAAAEANSPPPKPEAPAPAEAKAVASVWSPHVLQPVRLLRPPQPKVRPPAEPPAPKTAVPTPPPKPSVVPEQWWPPAPPKPVAIRSGLNESTTKGKGIMKGNKGKGKGKGKAAVPPGPKIAPKKRPQEEAAIPKAHTCMHAHVHTWPKDMHAFIHAYC